MYKVAMKRVLAVVLAFCMAFSMPDLALLASELDAGALGAMAQEEAVPETEAREAVAPEAKEQEEIAPETEMREETVPETGLQETSLQEAASPRAGTKTFEGVVVQTDSESCSNLHNEGDGVWRMQLQNPVAWNGGATQLKDLQISKEGVTLSSGNDYLLSAWQNNKVPSRDGFAELIVDGWGDYEGSRLIISYEIKIRLVPGSVTMTEKKDLGSQSRQSLLRGRVSRLTITDSSIGGAKLRQVPADSNEDGYSLDIECDEYSETANITVVGHGIYMDSYTYTDVPVVDAGFEGNVSLSYEGQDISEHRPVYTGMPIEPEVAVTDLQGNPLTEGTDYEVSFEDNINVPTEGSKRLPTVIVEGIGAYFGIKEATFAIEPAALEDIFELRLPQESVVYNKKKAGESAWGVQIPDAEPEVLNKNNEGMPAESGDYRLEYAPVEGTDSAGRRFADVIVYPDGDNIKQEGRITERYAIEPASFVQSAYPADSEDYVTVEWADGTPDAGYTGSSWEPQVRVTQNGEMLVEGEDYDVRYGKNDNAEDGGTATVIPGPNGNYTGEREMTFNIRALDLRELAEGLPEIPAQEYQNGQKIEPKFQSPWIDAVFESGVRATLREGEDYVLEYEDNTRVGTGKVIVKATGSNCIGSKTIPFTIYESLSIEDSDVTIEVPDQQYTGARIDPEPVVKQGGVVVENTDLYQYFTCSYDETEDRVLPGTYSVTVRGDQKFYLGMKKVTFRIVPRQMSTLKAEYVNPLQNSGEYTGSAHVVPEGSDIKISVIKDKDITLASSDFDFSWSDSRGNAVTPVNAGTYKLKISPKSGRPYSGSALLIDYTITKKELQLNEGGFKITLDDQDSLFAVYTGKVQRPVVHMTYHGKEMVQDRDFTVQHNSNSATNTNVGNSFVQITGKGNFSGTLRADFQIRPLTVTPQTAATMLRLTFRTGADYTYTGGAIGPAITDIMINAGSNNSIRLREGTDYEIVLDQNADGTDASEVTKVGAHSFILKLKGNYSSAYKDANDADQDGIDAVRDLGPSYSYTVTAKDISAADVSVAPIPNQIANAAPEVDITYQGKKLVKDTDYTLSYEGDRSQADNDNTPAENRPRVVITGINNFAGTRTEYFHVRKDISGVTVLWDVVERNIIYSGNPWYIRPRSKDKNGVVLNSVSLQEAEWDDSTKAYRKNLDGSYPEEAEYIVEWENNVNAGTMTAKIVGINEYGGVGGIKTFTIKPIELLKNDPKLTVILSDGTLVFSGSPLFPKFNVTYNGKKLQEGEDYKVVSNSGDPIVDGGQNLVQYNIEGLGNFGGIYKAAASCNTLAKKMSDVEAVCTNADLSQLDWADDSISSKLTFEVRDKMRDGITGEALESPADSGEGYLLTSGNEYEPVFKEYQFDGKISVSFRGKGKNYDASSSTGNLSVMIPLNFENGSNNVEAEFTDRDDMEQGVPCYTYKGTGFAPTYAVKISSASHTDRIYQGKEYTAKIVDAEGNEYTSVSECGDYKVVFKGREGTPLENFEHEAPFKVVPRSLNDSDVVITTATSPLELNYTGSNRWPNSETNKREVALSLQITGKNPRTLVEGKDFEIIPPSGDCWEMSDPEGAPYHATIRGIGNFKDDRDQEYRIADNFNVNIAFKAGYDTMESGVPVYSYTGSRIVPDMIVTDRITKKTLVLNVDYYIDFGDSDCKNASDYPVTITLRGLGGKKDSVSPFCGSATTQFRIQRRSLSSSNMKGQLRAKDLGSYTYNYGDQVRPKPEIVWDRPNGKGELALTGSDIEFVYGPNDNVGTGWLTVRGVGRSFSNQYSERFEFEILQKSIEDEDVNAELANPVNVSENGLPQYFYTGEPVEPEWNITWGEGGRRKLNPGDYTVTYEQDGEEGKHSDIGTVSVTVEGTGNYKGTISLQFEIIKIRLSALHVELKGSNEDGNFYYTGQEIEPVVELSYIATDGQKFVLDQETWGYHARYENNLEVGTDAKVIITTDEDNPFIEYDPTPLEKIFAIERRPIGDVSAVEIVPDPIPLQLYDPDEDADGVKPELSIKNIFLDAELEASPEGTTDGDYGIEYQNNADYTEEGSPASLTITGHGNYADTKVMEFDIARDVTKYLSARLDLAGDLVYNGTEQKPEPVIEQVRTESLALGTDYEIEYDEDCVNAGTHAVTVKGIGHYGGEIRLEFEILPRDITDDEAIVFTAEGEYIYTGSDIVPVVTGMDGDTPLDMESFEVSEADTREPGPAKVTVSAKEGSNYKGFKEVTFEILKAQIGEKPEGTEDYIQVIMEQNQEYTGSQIIPEITLKDTRRNAGGSAITEEDGEDYYVLQEGEDYVIKPFESETENVNPGPASITVIGEGHYEGERTLRFDIKVKIENADVAPIPAQEYNGTSIQPKPVLALDGNQLQEGLDYSLEYDEDCVNAGAHTITITGQGNYMGSMTVEFTILPRDISNVAFTIEGEYEYVGSEIHPKVAGTDAGLGNAVLTEDVDFVVTASAENVGPGPASVTVAPKENSNYTGEARQISFEILPANVAADYIRLTMNENQEYTGSQIVPEFVLEDTRRNEDGSAREKEGEEGEEGPYYKLVEGVDYEIAPFENDEVNRYPGPGSITVKGTGNYGKERTISFMIRTGLSQAQVSPIEPQPFTGKEIKPVPEVTLDGKKLEPDVDYALTYDEDCAHAGTHKIVITGIGSYAGEKTVEYVILQREISHIAFTVEGEYLYHGSEQAPVIRGLDAEISAEPFALGEEFAASSENLTDAGMAEVTITAAEHSNYTGSQKISFEIKKADITADYIEASVGETADYTGEPVKPEIILTDMRRDENGAVITAGDYEGGHYRLVEGVDYKADAAGNVYPGTAAMAVSGTGNYKGLLEETEFSIIADLEKVDIAKIPSQAYTGEEIEPELTVTIGTNRIALEEDEDYTAEYFDNIERGTASVTIRAVEGSFYSGEKTVTFKIGRGIGEAEVRLISQKLTYTGNPLTPAAAVWLNGIKLTKDVDYEVAYENNVNAGTATVIITGIEEYGGQVRATFEIVRRSVIRCSFSNISQRIYNGQPTSQDVVVTDDETGRTLALGKDYALEYFNNTNPGVATLRVTGIGNYDGVKTIMYVINVQNMQAVTASAGEDSVTLRWQPVLGASGYAVYDSKNELIDKTAGTSYKHKGLSALTTYSYKVIPYMTSDGATYYGGVSNTVTAKTSIKKPSVKLKAGKKKITISWKKVKGVSGYVVYRSTKKTKGYKKVKTVKKDSVVKYTNKSLTSKKKYYYKVRAYKKVNGKNVYSKYSSPKSVKAK